MALEHGGHALDRTGVQMEKGLHARGVGACAHEVRRGATAQHDAERIYDDALASARLARKGVELIVQAQVKAVNDGEIGDLKLCEHSCVTPAGDGDESGASC